MEPTTEKYRQGLGKKEAFLISSLARENKNIFNTDDVKAVVGDAAKRTVANLVRKKWILKLKRGLYAIVPPRHWGERCRQLPHAQLRHWGEARRAVLHWLLVGAELLFEKKRRLKDVAFVETAQFFPDGVFDILQPYWERELGRLVSPLPDLKNVLEELKASVAFLQPS